MLERCLRETNEATYIRGYWVGGQRFRLPNRESGWYIATWSDSVPIVCFWIADGKFYKARTHWIESTTFDIEVSREVIDIDPERKKITLDAIGEWQAQKEHTLLKRIAPVDSPYHLAPG
jgi:hypothetical protein